MHDCIKAVFTKMWIENRLSTKKVKILWITSTLREIKNTVKPIFSALKAQKQPYFGG